MRSSLLVVAVAITVAALPTHAAPGDVTCYHYCSKKLAPCTSRGAPAQWLGETTHPAGFVCIPDEKYPAICRDCNALLNTTDPAYIAEAQKEATLAAEKALPHEGCQLLGGVNWCIDAFDGIAYQFDKGAWIAGQNGQLPVSVAAWNSYFH